MATSSALAAKKAQLGVQVKETIAKSLRTAKFSAKVSPGRKSFVDITPSGIQKLQSISESTVAGVVAEFNRNNPEFFARVKNKFDGANKLLIEINENIFLELAKFIFAEIQKNLVSTELENIQKGMLFANRRIDPDQLFTPKAQTGIGFFFTALLLFRDQVKTGAPWDYKNNADFLELYAGNDFAADYPENKFMYRIDFWGNWHFGYMGMEAGFTEGTLLAGAGLAQLWSDGKGAIDLALAKSQFKTEESRNVLRGLRDQFKGVSLKSLDRPEDKPSIAAGTGLWKKKGRNITLIDMLESARGMPVTQSKQPVKP